MLWFWIVIVSQFANAGAQLLDKLLLTKKFSKPAVLTFYTALWNLFALVFIFFDFNWFPDRNVLIVSLISGVAFTIALQFFYMGMKKGEASHIAPLVGGVVPVVSFIISYFWLDEVLTEMQIWAVVLLVIGTLLISFEKSRRHSGIHIGMLWAVLAGVFFAIAYVLARWAYLQESFSTGFVWARMGSFIAVLPFLLSSSLRRSVFGKNKKSKKKLRSGLAIFAINKSLAAFYFVGMNFAMSLASATLVNALAGLQYGILFFLIYFFSQKKPSFFKEYFTKHEIKHQLAAIMFLIIGLALLVLD